MSADHEKAPWNGETYASFGHDESRSWDEAVEHGFICAGGGPWYSNTLNLLSVGDRIWVKVPGRGFVGVGRVAGNATRAADFLLQTPTGKEPALDVLTRGTYHREYINNLERSEYFVPVKWLQTVPFEQSIHEVGMFGNQNTICRPTTPKWNYTIEQLKRRFPRYDG